MTSFTVRLLGQPLRRTYVSHFDFFRSPQTKFFRTNDNGNVTVTGVSGPTKVRIHAQNTVVRVLDGNSPIPIEVSQEFNVAEGGTININTAPEQVDHFRVMDTCLVAYDTTFRQFRPFNRSNRLAIPFGSAPTILETRNQLPRIELVYPDNSPSVYAWVEPVSVWTGYPLMHIKHKSVDGRLFGEQGNDPTLIPHELAHALYFALMPATLRASVEAQYVTWLGARFAAGLPPFHNTSLVTTPFVAWVESLGLFSERFFLFSTTVLPPATGSALRQAFFRDELSSTPLLGSLKDHHPKVGEVNGSGVVAPALLGDDVEGALYGAIFLDLARRVGLREAVGLYLDSRAGNVLEFDDFHNWIINDTDFDAEIIEVKNTWNL